MWGNSDWDQIIIIRNWRPHITLICCILIVMSLSAFSQEQSLTFFLVSDTHYGASETIAGANRSTIDMMKKLPGAPFPKVLASGEVQTPLGVIHCGDILDGGEASDWDDFRADYGVDGDGRINYPVYESFGNHDGGINGPVRRGIIERNKHRPGVTNISDNGLHYSWDWGDIHFINTNLYPGSEWDSTCEWCHYFKEDFKYPLNSLEFLKKDLEENIGKSNKPVIIIQHYGWDNFSDLWWTDSEKEAYYQVIKDYNIIAIFQGHSHAVEKFTWKGLDIWSVGSGQKDPDPGSCLVVQIREGKMIIAERRPGSWGYTSSKSLQKK